LAASRSSWLLFAAITSHSHVFGYPFLRDERLPKMTAPGTTTATQVE
jgi:hypothetical protein